LLDRLKKRTIDMFTYITGRGEKKLRSVANATLGTPLPEPERSGGRGMSFEVDETDPIEDYKQDVLLIRDLYCWGLEHGFLCYYDSSTGMRGHAKFP